MDYPVAFPASSRDKVEEEKIRARRYLEKQKDRLTPDSPRRALEDLGLD
jgi:LPS O-antigen subunit length determinant protein (WzzB/FepE family)